MAVGPATRHPAPGLAGAGWRRGRGGRAAAVPVRLLPGPSVPLSAGYPHPHMAPPWWIVEMPASPDNHTADRHFHLDHVFVGLYAGGVREPETRVRWMSEHELAQAPGVPEDVRLPANELFAEIARLAGPAAC